MPVDLDELDRERKASEDSNFSYNVYTGRCVQVWIPALAAELRAARDEAQAARKEIEDLHEIALDYSRERDEARARAADRDERQEAYATCMVKLTDALAEIAELKHNLASVMELREIATGELKTEVARLRAAIKELHDAEEAIPARYEWATVLSPQAQRLRDARLALRKTGGAS